MCCKALHQNLPEFPVYGNDLERLLLCEDPKKQCWLQSCGKCVDPKKRLSEIVKRSKVKPSTITIWCRWKKNKDVNRFEKCLETGTLKSLVQYFHDILPEFLRHSYIKRSQAAQFNEDEEEVAKSNGTVATLQFDFAESYCCDSQDEVQPAHWSQANV